MLKNRISSERLFYKNVLIERLSTICKTFGTSNIYLDGRASEVVLGLITEPQIYGTGLTQLFTEQQMKENRNEFDKMVVVTVLDDDGFAEIQKYLHFFKSLYIFNLTFSDNQVKQRLRVSSLRKKMNGFLQISLNFVPFIDSVYTAISNDSKRSVSFAESFTSFLTSLPKFHQFQFYHSSYSSKMSSIVEKIHNILNTKLQILQRYKSDQYRPTSSPRIKVLFLDRKKDQMSPLIYSYYYGPLSQQINFNQKQFTARSQLFRVLFSMDYQQARQFLSKIIEDKVENKKMKFQLHQFEKAKKTITNHFDDKTTPAQITVHVQIMSTLKEFCKLRAMTTALQQTIVNARSEQDQKMSAGKIVDRIVEWSNIPLQEFKPSQQDYFKILILSYFVNSFWFFHRRIINACLVSAHKDKIITYCKSIENTCKPLKQKKQGQQRFDLYRHDPALVNEAVKWSNGEITEEYSIVDVNKSATNRQTKLIIAVSGPLGYNELAFLMKQFQKTQQKIDVTFFCEKLVTTKEYLHYLLKGQKY